jgi:hypothetical protein
MSEPEAIYMKPWMRCPSTYNFSEWGGHIAIEEAVSFESDDEDQEVGWFYANCIFCGETLKSRGMGYPWQPTKPFVIQEETEIYEVMS